MKKIDLLEKDIEKVKKAVDYLMNYVLNQEKISDELPDKRAIKCSKCGKPWFTKSLANRVSCTCGYRTLNLAFNPRETVKREGVNYVKGKDLETAMNEMGF